ncbi:MAG: hypothetical protein ACM3SW_17150 [Actinomycetota bacterium]
MFEEFLLLASSRGLRFAKRWYWRQTRQSIAHLFARAFGANLWLTAVIVITGVLLHRFVFTLPERAIFAALDRYQVFERHFSLYVFFATYGLILGHIFSSLLIGIVIALLARRTEMVSTISIGFALCAMTVAGIIWSLSTGHTFIFSMLPWHVADWLAIVLGGVMVRMHRFAGNRFSAV